MRRERKARILEKLAELKPGGIKRPSWSKTPEVVTNAAARQNSFGSYDSRPDAKTIATGSAIAQLRYGGGKTYPTGSRSKASLRKHVQNIKTTHSSAALKKAKNYYNQPWNKPQ